MPMTRRRLLASLAAVPAGAVPLSLSAQARHAGLITGNQQKKGPLTS